MAAKKATVLAGNFGNLRPPDPDQFFSALADVLEQYPLGLVEECVHPVHGIATKVEFLSIKTLVEWLDTRLAFYQGLASYVATPKRADKRFTPEQEDRGIAAVRGLLRCLKEGREVATLTFDEAVRLGKEP